MKTLKLLSGLGVLAGTGAALAFGLAGPVGAVTGTTTGSTPGLTTTTTGHGKHGWDAKKRDKGEGDKLGTGCHVVVLAGSAGTGGVTLTVTRASGQGKSGLIGKQITLTVPAGSALHAVACSDAAGALTLKQLVVGVAHASPSAKRGS